MHKRRDAGQEGCRRLEIEERRFAGNVSAGEVSLDAGKKADRT